MRPDEYLRQDAQLFQEIALCKNAIYDGIQSARDEQKAASAIKDMLGDD